MKGSGTVRRGGLESKLRMSFVFSAGREEERKRKGRLNREEERRKHRAQPQHRHSPSSGLIQPHTGTLTKRALLLKGIKNQTKPNYCYHVALQHHLTHRSQNIPWQGRAVISLHSSTKGERPHEGDTARVGPLCLQ